MAGNLEEAILYASEEVLAGKTGRLKEVENQVKTRTKVKAARGAKVAPVAKFNSRRSPVSKRNHLAEAAEVVGAMEPTVRGKRQESNLEGVLRAYTKFKVCFNCGNKGHVAADCEVLLGGQDIQEMA
uniref:CCHC-type domain-containing protein n=1 Tax=Bracon brevicornis TaxID=1563983 RepID=A0A6V7KPZ2_9HYME